MRTGKQALIEQFLAAGITHMFGNPGTVEQGFLDALEEFPDFHYVLTLQETVAAGIADGYARATGGPALLQLHSGVGLGNGIGMIYQAKRGHAPLVVVAGESGIAYDSMDAQMAADLVSMARPVTKWATRVVDPSSLLRVVRRAVKVAMTPPRGPVFLCLPMDVLDAENSEPVLAPSIPSSRVQPEAALVDRAADLLLAGRRPLVLVGDGVATSGGAAAVVAVAEALGADVWGVDSSEPNMPADHPLYRGLTGHMFGEVSTRIVAEADAVLIAGTYVFPEVFPSLVSPFAPDARIVHVDLDDWEIAKNHPVDLGVVADPALTLGLLAERLRTRADAGYRQEAAARLDRARSRRQEQDAAGHPGDDSLMAAFVAALARRVGEDVMIFDEALTASPVLARALPPVKPGHHFLTRGGSLGVGVPGAVGMKIAHPDRQVLAFVGDGGAMYTYQGLWSAARHGVGVKIVVCNNHRYDLLNRNIEQYWRERDIPHHEFPHSFDLATPEIDFVGLAAALGVNGMRLDKPELVDEAVDRLLADDRPFVIDLLTDDLTGH